MFQWSYYANSVSIACIYITSYVSISSINVDFQVYQNNRNCLTNMDKNYQYPSIRMKTNQKMFVLLIVFCVIFSFCVSNIPFLISIIHPNSSVSDLIAGSVQASWVVHNGTWKSTNNVDNIFIRMNINNNNNNQSFTIQYWYWYWYVILPSLRTKTNKTKWNYHL